MGDSEMGGNKKNRGLSRRQGQVWGKKMKKRPGGLSMGNTGDLRRASNFFLGSCGGRITVKSAAKR